MPGDSPGFDLYDGRCEFLISTKRQEIHDERISEPEPYEMGLQVSHCVHTEATKEESVWRTETASRRDFSRVSLHKESKIVEGHMMGDHVHMCLSIPPKYAVLNVVGYLKGKSAIQIARRFGGRQKNFTGEHFWARGYFVSTVGLEENIVRAYIRNQEEEDERYDQMKLVMG
jgi:REP-associated tyrosine transposase